MTFTEGIALAGIILSLFLAYLNHRTGKEARQDAREQAKETRDSAAAEARAARLFDARRKVYVDALDYVYRIETWAARTEPAFTWEGMPVPPEFPPEEEQRHQSAEVGAFGSQAVRDKLMELKSAGDQFQAAVWNFQNERALELHGDKQIEARVAMNARRDALKALVRDIVELVNGELST